MDCARCKPEYAGENVADHYVAHGFFFDYARRDQRRFDARVFCPVFDNRFIGGEGFLGYVDGRSGDGLAGVFRLEGANELHRDLPGVISGELDGGIVIGKLDVFHILMFIAWEIVAFCGRSPARNEPARSRNV